MAATDHLWLRGPPMKRILLAVAGALAIAATPAAAADMPAPVYKAPPPVVVPFSWTGFYFGGHAGGAWGNVEWTHTNTGGIVENFDQDSSGFVWGGHAGFMYQVGQWVFGVEGTYTRLDLSETSVALLSADRSNSHDLKNMATVVGRLGMAWDRSLFYVQGGWATAKTEFNRFVTSTGATTASSSDWDNGWTIGVGGAYAFTNNFIFGVEYNFARIDIDNRIQTLAPGFVGTDTVTNATA